MLWVYILYNLRFSIYNISLIERNVILMYNIMSTNVTSKNLVGKIIIVYITTFHKLK